MNKETNKPQKFKLVKRHIEEDSFASSQKNAPPKAAEAATPIRLRSAQETKQDDQPLQKTEDILKYAYEAEKKASRRKHQLQFFKRFSFRCFMVLLFFWGTLIYAHGVAGVPALKPAIWYVPFFLSAALSTWFYFQAARFWDQAYQLLAIFGLIIAGALVYWNVHILKFAASGDQQKLSARLSVPESVAQLYFSGEFDALRGVPESRSAYARITPAVYRRAFYAMPRNEWRSHFQRYLNSAEMRDINDVNIDKKMHEVARRISKKREESLDQMEAEIKNPSFELQIQQALLRPYTWIIGYLQ